MPKNVWPPGDTIWEQRCFIEKDDHLRRFVLNEPRGGVFRHVNLLVPPKDPQAQVGWIIMEPADTPPMSGSNAICVATVVLDTGIVPMTEPETAIVPTVSGRAWITGTHQLMLDPDDPWPEGYRIADTWPVI